MEEPIPYNADIFEQICSELENGTPLAQILRDNEGKEGWPKRSRFYEWKDLNEETRGRFARGREIGGHAIADDCIAIADDNSRDIIVTDIGDGIKTETVNHEHIQRSKLRIETRLKLLAKWFPKEYGDKIDVTTGGDKLPAASMSFEVVQPKQADE